VNGKYCEGMAAGARYASEVLKREVFLWEVQRILGGMKRVSGLEVIRADVPHCLSEAKKKRVKTARRLSAEHRRKIGEASRGRKGYWRGKRITDYMRHCLSEAKVGEKNPRSKLTEEQVWEIKDALAKGEKILTLALRYKVRESLISMIKNGKRWKHITEDKEDWV